MPISAKALEIWRRPVTMTLWPSETQCWLLLLRQQAQSELLEPS